MATTAIHNGLPITLVQNVVYALPARRCQVTTSIALESSNDQVGWAALTTGSTTSAVFVRCPTGAAVVSCKDAGLP